MGAGIPIPRPVTAGEILSRLGLSGLTAGAILFASGATTLDKLPLGTAGRLLVAGASAPAWSSKLAEGTITGLMTLSKAGSTAREMTFPDASITVAGIDLAQTWTATQTIQRSNDAITVLLSTQNTSAGTSAANRFNVLNDAGNGFTMIAYGSNYSGTVFGLAGANLCTIGTGGASTSAIAIGAGTNIPVVFVQSSAERMRLTASLATISTALTSTGTVTVPDGSAASPGLRTTTEASGLYRFSATALGFSAAGVAVANITSGGTATIDAGATGASLTVGNTAGSNGSISIQRTSVPCLILTSGGGGSIRLQQSNSATNTLQIADSTGASLYVTVTPTSLGTITDMKVGLGVAASSAAALNISNLALASAAQYGVLAAVTATSAATGSLMMLDLRPATAAAVFTCAGVYGLHYTNVSLGSGSSATAQYAIRIDALSGATANYAFYSSGAGLVQIGDTTDATTTSDGSVRMSGGLSLLKSIVAGGKITGPACTTSIATLNVPHGTAPSAPANGDIWSTTAGLYVRINGATVGPLGATTPAGSTTQLQFNNSGAMGASAYLTWDGATLKISNESADLATNAIDLLGSHMALTAGRTFRSSCGLSMTPKYSGAFTLDEHRYFTINTPQVVSATVTSASLIYFDANAGTHKAVDSGTTKTSPGTVSAWIKVNVNGTIHYLPIYTSKTT